MVARATLADSPSCRNKIANILVLKRVFNVIFRHLGEISQRSLASIVIAQLKDSQSAQRTIGSANLIFYNSPLYCQAYRG